MAHESVIQLTYVAGILLGGFLLSKIASRLIIKAERKEKYVDLNKKDIIKKSIEKGIVILSFITALFYMGFSSWNFFIGSFIDSMPKIITVILLFILGVFVINMLSWIIKELVFYTGLQEYIEDEAGQHLLKLLFLIKKIVLYLILIEIIVSFVNLPVLNTVLDFILYPGILSLFAVLFVALINPIRDYSSAFYIKNVFCFKAGNIIKMDGQDYEIKKISNVSTELKTRKGQSIILPNRVLASKQLEFKKPSKDIETLEDLKHNFHLQLPSYCGPASAQIALAIFRISSDQEELANLMGSIKRKNRDQKIAGTHPDNLINAVKRYTKGKVLGAWIGFDKIYELRKEVKSWLSEGAIVIVDYKKKYLFPKAKTAHYSLVLGVKGDEFLIVDPSSKSGGVYYSDYRDIATGMDTYSELIRGKRGYIVLAPKGSVAFKRIEEGIIYLHPSMYKKITKKIESRINKITSTVTWYETIPSFVKRFLKDYKKEQVQRVWRP